MGPFCWSRQTVPSFLSLPTVSQPCGGVSAVCRSPLRVPSGRVTSHTPRDVKAAQVGCGAWGRARLGLDTRGRLGSPHGKQHLLAGNS